MIRLKTAEEITVMAEGGARLREVMRSLVPNIHSGMTTKQIDREAERLIRKQGGEPSFKKVRNYYWTTCLPVNEQVVHTPPSSRSLLPGDILTIDIGMYYRGFHTDYADTIVVDGRSDAKKDRFLKTGHDALYKSIEKARVGNHIGDISTVIEKEVYGHGYFILKELTGHGIGRELHEDPYVFGYNYRPKEKTPVIRPGLVIAIEIIYSMGTEEIAYEDDSDWSIVTADGSLAACFEHTVAITDEKTEILT